MPRGSRSKPGRLSRPLDLSSLGMFPLRQEVALRPDPGPRVEAVARSLLEEAGFIPFQPTGLSPSMGGPGSGASLTWAGERGLRRRGVTSSTAVVPIIVVFVAGAILGGLDGYILGSPEVGILWVLGAAAVSGLFWLRFGGTYDSDVVLVTVSRPGPNAGASVGSVSVVVWAARIRSHIQADLRVPADVSGALKLAAEVGTLVREFRRRVSVSSAPGTVGRAPG